MENREYTEKELNKMADELLAEAEEKPARPAAKSRKKGVKSKEAAPEAAGRMTNRQKGSAGPSSATLPVKP